ncbi:MAG: hypothetical protein P1U65_04445 [Minwuia sp.]|nr:hypothetical protein [Minwuia sp.]
MSLENELKPYINALLDRKQPLGAIEMRGFVNTLTGIANRYNKPGAKGGRPAPPRPELSVDDMKYLNEQIQMGMEKLSSSAETILEAVDEIGRSDGDRKKIRSISGQIMQACDFDDIVGQRLMQMRSRLNNLGSVAALTPKETAGPTMDKSVDQDAIDKIFFE